MAYKIEFHTGEFLNYTAGAAITKGQLVSLNNAGQVIVATAASTNVIGVADETVASGEEVRVLSGYCIVYVQAGGAVTAGATLETVASGRVDDTTAGTCQDIAVAFDAATAAGDWIRIIANFPVFR